MAILLGGALPAFYLGQALGILCVLLAFATMLHPTIRAKIPETIRQLWQAPESKLLAIAVIFLLPSVFISIDMSQSARVWIGAVIVLALFSCLTVFKHATLNDKLLVIKIFIIGLLLWNSFIIAAQLIDRDWLVAIWNIRSRLGIVDKDKWFYIYTIPKLQLNGSFVLLPLLIYCSVKYLKQTYWRIIILLLIISFVILTIILINRALLAGTILILTIAIVSVWSCEKEAIAVKIATSFLLMMAFIAFSLFLFVPREKMDLLAFLKSDAKIVVAENTENTRDPDDVNVFSPYNTSNNDLHIMGQRALSVREKLLNQEFEGQIFDSAPLLKPFLPYAVMRAPRQIFIYEGFQQWKNSPIFGIGLNVSDRHQQLQNNVGTYFSTVSGKKSISNVHNRFVETLLETGIVGFIGLMSFLIILTLRHLRCYISTGHQPALVLVLTHAAYWVTGLFQFSIWETWIFVIFATSLVINHAFSMEAKKGI